MKRYVAFLFALVMTITLFSCQTNEPLLPNGENQETDDISKATDELPQEDEKRNFVLSTANAAEFVLLRPTEWRDESLNGVGTLKTKLQEMGLEIDSKRDYVKAGEEIPENESAILVGNTNRPASKKYYESLKMNDYIIAVEENQLIIVGGSDSATEKAIEDFITNHLKDLTSEINLPVGILSQSMATYSFDDITLLDKSISEYEIVLPVKADAICKHAASILSESFTAASGITLNVVYEDATSGKSQIQLVYKDSTLNDDGFMYNKTDKGFEIAATKRTMLYATRKIIARLKDNEANKAPDITPEISKEQAMKSEVYDIPDSLKGTTPIGLCDQKNNKAVVIDLSAEDPTSESAVLWEWTPSAENGFTGAGLKNRIDELKLVYSPVLEKYLVLSSSSSGFMGIAEYPSGEKVWEAYASGYGPHSIEYLPNGLVACALSGNGNKSKNEIRIYAVDENGYPTENYINDSLESAHSVLWDDEFGVLWALGGKELIAYEISGTPQSPTMTRIEGFGANIGSGGHDLSQVLNENGLFWFSSSAVKKFNKYSNTVLNTYSGSASISTSAVKSIISLPDGRIIRVSAANVYASHDTDTLVVFTPQEDGSYAKSYYRFEGRAFYKARLFLPL